KERGKGDVFKKTGPSKKWWRGFKQRHPELRLRRPDSLDRGRDTMWNRIFYDPEGDSQLHLIFNCDEAANLNKSAGQRVVVPSSQKHAHSVAAATNGHITVHCCVSAAGGTIPPIWFEKTFLKFAPSERPLLLIQDGAFSHVSCPLIKSAIASDVILLSLPTKTTHITQPLDVAVYRKMKIEAAGIMSHAKLIKSDV
ncbi:hypothetical protein MAR_029483, partial [Mya arenaria]